jgi:hypothetical protein
MCRARKIPNAVELRDVEANCQKCLDKADTDEVRNSMDVYKAGGTGPTIVTHHYEHVIAAVRAVRADTEED